MRLTDGISNTLRALIGAPARVSDEQATQVALANAQILRRVVNEDSRLIQSGDPQVMEFFSGGQASAAGSNVTPETAMRVASVYACTRLMAGAVATLPLPVYERDSAGGRRPAPEHPLAPLLNVEPTPRFSAATWWEYVMANMLLRGDQFNVILRSRNGTPGEIVPIPGAATLVERVDNRLRYYVEDNGKRRGFDQDDVLHFPGFGFDGRRSMSVIRYAAFQSIGTAMAMEEFAGKYFVNGAMQKVALQTPNDMSPEQVERLRGVWDRLYAGPDNAHRPMILYGGLTASAVSMTAEDTQLLESRRFQVEDIARAFGVPPFMIGMTDKTTSWGSGVEAMGLGFLVFTLAPHLTRIEQEINRKLLAGSGYFVEFNRAGILQADSKGRADYLRQAIGGSNGPGWMSLNEARKVENLPPDPAPSSNALYAPSAAAMKPAAATSTEPKGQE